MQQDATNTQAKPARRLKEVSTCLYPSKRCDNPRGVKRNGELHNFCDFHRSKANFNQRRLEHKRKYQQEAAPLAVSLPPEALQCTATPLPSQQLRDNKNATPYQDLPSTTLEPDDIWILQELLKVESASDELASDHNCP